QPSKEFQGFFQIAEGCLPKKFNNETPSNLPKQSKVASRQQSTTKTIPNKGPNVACTTETQSISTKNAKVASKKQNVASKKQKVASKNQKVTSKKQSNTKALTNKEHERGEEIPHVPAPKVVEEQNNAVEDGDDTANKGLFPSKYLKQIRNRQRTHKKKQRRRIKRPRWMTTTANILMTLQKSSLTLNGIMNTMTWTAFNATMTKKFAVASCVCFPIFL
ncbi:hypothetical protein HJC23_007411, partial [Cyclotella cryptica]